MNQDEALDTWLGAELPMLPVPNGIALNEPMVADYIKGTAREAWHAAVADTLGYVAYAMHEQAKLYSGRDSRFTHRLAEVIKDMVPKENSHTETGRST